MSTYDWTEERVTRLKELVAAGDHSFSEIAYLMGCASRNVPLCKWNRLKAQNPELVHPHVRMGGPIPRVRKLKLVSSQPSVPKAPEADEIVPLQLDGVPITEENCGNRMCRFPYGDPGSAAFHYCGHAKKADSSYCEGHHKKVYKPNEVRRGKQRAA